MKKEEKLIVIKDICARLPYNVKIKIGRKQECVLSVGVLFDIIAEGTIPRPYLRPMSSMTEEEKKKVHYFVESHKLGNCSRSGAISDYLNSIHIDYRDLIPMGLALPATNGMYDI